MILPRAIAEPGTQAQGEDDWEELLASPHVRALALEIAYRLRPFCGHLSEGEMVKLVTRLAVAQQVARAPGVPLRP